METTVIKIPVDSVSGVFLAGHGYKPVVPGTKVEAGHAQLTVDNQDAPDGYSYLELPGIWLRFHTTEGAPYAEMIMMAPLSAVNGIWRHMPGEEVVPK